MSELIFYLGTMDSGKSTLALQTHHNHSVKGRKGILYTTNDRSGESYITSRLGLSVPAINIIEEDNIYTQVAEILNEGKRVDYIICDEAQFYSTQHIEQLADIVDGLNIDVYAFGITTDFKTNFFPASARLIELADKTITPTVPALCWCGKQATHQARLVDGEMVTEGELIVVGDIVDTEKYLVSYEVLCRKHHRQKLTANIAKAQPATASIPQDVELQEK
jgi:thymidine kinase